MLKKIMLFLMLIVTISEAVEKYRFDTVLYSGGIQYENSIRDSGIMTGIYFYIGAGLEHSLEGELDYTYIKYLNQPDLNQYDISFLYTNYSLINRKFRLGYHRIFTDDKNTDMGSIFTFGYEYYVPYRYAYGFDLNYSFYPEYTTDKKGLSVFQITPNLSYSFGDYYSYGSFTTGIKGYIIKLSNNTGFGKDFYSIEGDLKYFYRNVVLGFSIWDGEQSFAVKKHGFIVYNLSEKYIGGYSLFFRYLLNNRTSFTGRYGETDFKESGSIYKSKGKIFLITVGTTF